jgi:cytochrome c6
MTMWQQRAAGRLHGRVAAVAELPRAGPGLAKDGKRPAQAFPETALRRAPERLKAQSLAQMPAQWLAQMLAQALALLAGLALTAPAAAGDALRGSDLYRSHCAHCHGPSGKPVLPGAPDFKQPTALLKPDTALLALIREGRGAMPGYAGLLRDREILDLVSHLRTLR